MQNRRRGRTRYRESYDGRHAVVTGAGSGMGRETCLALGALGATVFASDVDGDAAASTAATVRERGGRADSWVVDVADAKQVDELVRAATERWDRIDYMFNIAGVHIAGDYHEFGATEWQRLLGINLWGVIHGTNAAYAVMREQGHGHIVNMGSLSGLTPTPMQAPYAATKAAVIQLSASLREEAKRFGVRVSAVCPGAIRTNLFAHGEVLNGRDPEYMDRIAQFMHSPEKAARKILSGVARNKSMILFPAHARVVYGLYRIHPAFTLPYTAAVRWAMGRNRASN